MDPQCLVCGAESTDQQVMNEGLSATGNLFPPDSFSSLDNGDLLLRSIKKRSKAWGIHWSLTAAIAWGLWKERNARRKTTTCRIYDQIAKSSIRMVSITFKESSFKKSHGTLYFPANISPFLSTCSYFICFPLYFYVCKTHFNLMQLKLLN